MTITSKMVKELRDLSGVGMMDCKKALEETNGDIEAAVDLLRKKGLASAAKKAGRATAEGLVAAFTEKNKGVLIEVNSETDFVALNEKFQEFVKAVAGIALSGKDDLESLKGAPYPASDRTVDGQTQHLVSIIGENINVRRCSGLAVQEGLVASYIHSAVQDHMGKIGVLIALESKVSDDKLRPLARQIAMHIAASKPLAVTEEDLDARVVERERSVLMEQSASSGKPKEIIEKMVEGRMRKYFEDVLLVSQTFVIDGDRKISQVIQDAEKELGGDIKIKGFKCFTLGEGIEKKEADFASEVASAVQG